MCHVSDIMKTRSKSSKIGHFEKAQYRKVLLDRDRLIRDRKNQKHEKVMSKSQKVSFWRSKCQNRECQIWSNRESDMGSVTNRQKSYGRKNRHRIFHSTVKNRSKWRKNQSVKWKMPGKQYFQDHEKWISKMTFTTCNFTIKKSFVSTGSKVGHDRNSQKSLIGESMIVRLIGPYFSEKFRGVMSKSEILTQSMKNWCQKTCSWYRSDDRDKFWTNGEFEMGDILWLWKKVGQKTQNWKILESIFWIWRAAMLSWLKTHFWKWSGGGCHRSWKLIWVKSW